MVGSELRLATLKGLLCRINFYEKLILHHGYEKLGTSKNKKRFDNLRNSINGEVSQILNELKTEGVDHPREDFSWGETIVCLENEGEFKSFVVEVKKISVEIFKESEILNIASIANFDVTPEWLFPTSTADVKSDITIINSFVEGDF